MRSIFLILIIFLLTDLTSAQIFNPAKMRALVDTIGFSFTPDQIKTVVAFSELLEQNSLQANQSQFYPTLDRPWVAAICPHDDHLLAGRVYVHIMQNLQAKRIILFGVAHKAWRWQVENQLIFDSFPAWRGPMGPVKVAELRQEIIARLPVKDFLINNDFQSEEHSVEGIIPFLQFYLPEAEIVSILVPYMSWHRIHELSGTLASALLEIISQKSWILGKDIAFICSNDGNHYGDQDWGDKNLAPFGADESGYLKATQRDSNLIRDTLTGILSGQKLQEFCKNVWDEQDLKSYKMTWCGRFSIPFGLETVRKLIESMQQPPLTGILLRYDTSYQLGRLPLDIGIGTTAPYNIHHWVGYSAIGYH